MKNPYTLRRPWVAFLIAFLLQPFLAMLYLGRGRWAGFYFVLLLLTIIGFFGLYPSVLGSFTVGDGEGLFELPLRLIGAIHCGVIAWRRPQEAPLPWFSRWYIVLGIPLAYIALLFANRAFLFPPFYTPSAAMEPLLGKDDGFLVSRRAFDFSPPRRGDVIALWVPSRNINFVKRIVALPGEKVALHHGRVFINGKALPRTPLTSVDALEIMPDVHRFHVVRESLGDNGPGDEMAEVTVPAGHYFVLGDNRDNSLDSRFAAIGFIDRKDITGPVVLRVWDGAARHPVWQPIR